MAQFHVHCYTFDDKAFNFYYFFMWKGRNISFHTNFAHVLTKTKHFGFIPGKRKIIILQQTKIIVTNINPAHAAVKVMQLLYN